MLRLRRCRLRQTSLPPQCDPTECFCSQERLLRFSVERSFLQSKKSLYMQRAYTGHRKQKNGSAVFCIHRERGSSAKRYTKNTIDHSWSFSSSIQTILSVLDFHQIMRQHACGLYRRSGISPCPEEYHIYLLSYYNTNGKEVQCFSVKSRMKPI